MCFLNESSGTISRHGKFFCDTCTSVHSFSINLFSQISFNVSFFWVKKTWSQLSLFQQLHFPNTLLIIIIIVKIIMRKYSSISQIDKKNCWSVTFIILMAPKGAVWFACCLIFLTAGLLHLLLFCFHRLVV